MTFKKNIATDPRVFYTLDGGNDNEDGLSLETAKATIQGAVNAVNALSPPPNALNRASIIVEGAGIFSENITFPNFTSVDAGRATNAVSLGTNYTIGSFSGYSFGLTAHSGTSDIVFDISSQTGVSLTCSEVNVTGDGTICLVIGGTTDDSFFRFSQLRLIGDGSIGVNYKASNGEPEVILFASITLENDNTVAYIHDPSVSTARAIFDVGGISEIGSPLTTTGIRVLDGHLSAFVNEIIANDAIDLQGGELNIICNCITGDITVAVGSTLVCEIAEFIGVLTNNGTIQGRIGTQQFGTGFVTGPGPTVVDNSISTFSGTGGETIQSFDEATLINTGTITTLNINSPIASTGTSGFSVSNSLGTLKGELEYIESSDTVELLTTTAQLTFGQGPSAGTVEILGNDTQFLYQSGGTSNAFRIDLTSNPDTNPPFIIDTGGTNAAAISFFVGNRNPNGNVTGVGGDLYIRDSDIGSRIYQNRTFGSTTWTELGNVTTTQFGVDNTMIISNGTLQAIDVFVPVTTEQTGTTAFINIESASASGTASGVQLTDTLSAIQSQFIYNELTDTVIISENTANPLTLSTLSGIVLIEPSGAAPSTILEIESPGVTNGCEVRLLDSTGSTKSRFFYDESTDRTAIDGLGTGGLDILSASTIGVAGTSFPDTTALFAWITTGSNGGQTDVHIGARTPEGNVNADPGSLYFRSDGVNSDIYIQRAASAGTIGWVDVFESGLKTDLSTSVNNAIVIWDGTTADTVTQDPLIFSVSGASATALEIESPSVTGFAGITIVDNVGTTKLELLYSQSTDASSIDDESGNGLTIIGTAGLTLTAAANISINANTNANLVTINTDFIFGATTTNAILIIESPTATGEASIEFQNNASVDRLKVGYNQNTDIAAIETFLDTTILRLTSEEQPVNIDIQITDANPILNLSNTQNSFDIYSRSVDPQGVVSGTHGDIVVAGNGINNTAIFLQRESTSSTSWGQVELLQKQFDFVNTTSTLSLNHNRIFVNNTSNITLSLPTNASTSRSEGFEQTIAKTISNDNVITIDTPGFYGFTGNFVMSQRGNSVTYCQTATANEITNVNRLVIASMSRPFTAGEISINGSTGADIDLTIWTVNGESYNGLVEPDQVNDVFVWPDVENLSAGDQYLITLTVVLRWSNNTEITFDLAVDDSGITTRFPLLMRAQSTSFTDEVTMHGRALVRTGTNDTISLDTSITASFTLITGGVATFLGGIFTAEKLEGA